MPATLTMLLPMAQQAGTDAKSNIANMFSLLYAAHQLHSANKLEKTLKRPIYNVDENILNNQKMAQNIASGGLPDSTKLDYTNNLERNLSGGIGAIQNTGNGGLNSISNLFTGLNQAYGKVLALDAEQKLQNQKLLMDANKDVRDENQLAFDYNKNIPYQQLYNRINEQRNAAAMNMANALHGFAGQSAAKQTNSYDADAISSLASWLKNGNTTTGNSSGNYFDPSTDFSNWNDNLLPK